MKLFIFLTFGLISQSVFAGTSNVVIRNLFCTSALNHPSGVTTITYLGNNLVNISNKPFLGLPFTQNALIAQSQVKGDVLTLTFQTQLTNATLFLRMDSQNNKISLSTLGENTRLDMTCQADIDAE